MKLPEFKTQVLAHLRPILGDRLDEEQSTFTSEGSLTSPNYPIYVMQFCVDGALCAQERFQCGPSGEQARLDRFLKPLGDRLVSHAH